MHFRRLTLRYAEVQTRAVPRSLGDPWSQADRIVIARPEWRPAMDLYASEEEVVVKLELAGIREEDLNVILYADTLVVEGVRECSLPAQTGVYYSAEIHYGPFRLEVAIPGEVDPERASAHYEQGFAYIHLPRPGGDEG